MESKDNNWQDFTRNNYHRLLGIAAKKYKISAIKDWQTDGVTGLWRHDVDCSPQCALAFAKIESEAGVKATYYFNMRSEFYNLFEPAILEIVYSINEMGHEVGLHFDASQNDVSTTADFETSLSKEKAVFESMIGIQLKSFSFHNPSETTAMYKDLEYAGLINAYGSKLMNHFKYCSDSCGYWRFTSLEEFLMQDYTYTCVLTHPEWWLDEALCPRERIVHAVDGRAKATLRQYDSLLDKLGRKNIRL